MNSPSKETTPVIVEEQARYLSGRFTSEDFATMTNDKMYAFYSVPDTGKTTMISNVLQPYLKQSGKKALYLSHRRIINDQNEANLDDTLIHSRTYQKLEYDITHGNSFVSDYDFIICDECHYFVEDSAMNYLTDESFNFVNHSAAVIILMSGTPDCLKSIKDLWAKPIVELVGINTSIHNITKVCFASANKEEEALLKSQMDRLVKMRKRVIVYDSNIAELYQLSSEYKQKEEELGIKVSFICSSKNKAFAKFSDTAVLETLIDTRRIDSDLLFITSALNTGISIDEDFEYLFIFGNPAKTDIFQLIARVRKGSIDRRFKTVYCTVPKYNSIKCRLEGLLLDLTYLENPIDWQTQKQSKRSPEYMQERHSPMCDSEGKQLFTPQGNRRTQSQPGINHMKLGKLKHDICEYKTILSYHSMLEAYRQMFLDRYDNITTSVLKDELEQQGKHQIIPLLESYAILKYLGDDHQDTIKNLFNEYGLQTSIGKINEFLDKHDCGVRILSKQKKTHGHKFQVWYVERY